MSKPTNLKLIEERLGRLSPNKRISVDDLKKVSQNVLNIKGGSWQERKLLEKILPSISGQLSAGEREALHKLRYGEGSYFINRKAAAGLIDKMVNKVKEEVNIKQGLPYITKTDLKKSVGRAAMFVLRKKQDESAGKINNLENQRPLITRGEWKFLGRQSGGDLPDNRPDGGQIGGVKQPNIISPESFIKRMASRQGDSPAEIAPGQSSLLGGSHNQGREPISPEKSVDEAVDPFGDDNN